MHLHSLSVKWGNYSPGQEPTELTGYKNDCPHGQMQGPHTHKWVGRKGQSQSSKLPGIMESSGPCFLKDPLLS